MGRNSMFERYGKAYVPRRDEPSPFGAHDRLLANPWIRWANQQPEIENTVQSGHMLLLLKRQLNLEKYTLAEMTECEAPEILTPDGQLSLAWVIFMRSSSMAVGIPVTFELVHQRSMAELRKRQPTEGSSSCL